MILHIYTIIHVIISLAGILTGFVVLFGLLARKQLRDWTKWFLITTIATSVTGFFFPFHGLTPAYTVGAISLVVLGLAWFARYSRQLHGRWRWVYIITAMIALYLNVFVAIVQSFLKIPALHALAPTQTESPFQITQRVTLVLFVVLTIAAVVRFHPGSAPTADGRA
jgi:hypothetical protein